MARLEIASEMADVLAGFMFSNTRRWAMEVDHIAVHLQSA
jgi:hypothetical protein